MLYRFPKNKNWIELNKTKKLLVVEQYVFRKTFFDRLGSPLYYSPVQASINFPPALQFNLRADCTDVRKYKGDLWQGIKKTRNPLYFSIDIRWNLGVCGLFCQQQKAYFPGVV